MKSLLEVSYDAIISGRVKYEIVADTNHRLGAEYHRVPGFGDAGADFAFFGQIDVLLDSAEFERCQWYCFAAECIGDSVVVVVDSHG